MGQEKSRKVRGLWTLRTSDYCVGKVGEKYTFIDNNSFSRATLNLVASHSRTNFLTAHNSFINPTYLLSMGHATLHSINTSEVIFCISDPKIRVTESSVGPFLWSSGFLNAKELGIIPIRHLKTLQTLQAAHECHSICSSLDAVLSIYKADFKYKAHQADNSILEQAHEGIQSQCNTVSPYHGIIVI